MRWFLGTVLASARVLRREEVNEHGPVHPAFFPYWKTPRMVDHELTNTAIGIGKESTAVYEKLKAEMPKLKKRIESVDKAIPDATRLKPKLYYRYEEADHKFVNADTSLNRAVQVASQADGTAKEERAISDATMQNLKKSNAYKKSVESIQSARESVAKAGELTAAAKKGQQRALDVALLAHKEEQKADHELNEAMLAVKTAMKAKFAVANAKERSETAIETNKAAQTSANAAMKAGHSASQAAAIALSELQGAEKNVDKLQKLVETVDLQQLADQAQARKVGDAEQMLRMQQVVHNHELAVARKAALQGYAGTRIVDGRTGASQIEADDAGKRVALTSALNEVEHKQLLGDREQIDSIGTALQRQRAETGKLREDISLVLAEQIRKVEDEGRRLQNTVINAEQREQAADDVSIELEEAEEVKLKDSATTMSAWIALGCALVTLH